ncbi:MAG: hypothetical protein JWQ99_1038 [Blastococcus sp.]|nr:hypothetical protein [Blastococcus sp.]
MSDGPYLYDDDPEPLHTGAPRRSGKLLVLVFGATAVVAVLMVVLLPLIKGSPEDQAREVTGVFLAALDKGDTETAYGLLCDEERARLDPDEMNAEYVAGNGIGRIVSVEEGRAGDVLSRDVGVEWPGGGSATLVVVNSGGPRVCGITTG